MKTHKRTKDKGVTRAELIKILIKPYTIPQLKYRFSTLRLPKDCSIETALRNMLSDGIIEVIDEPRNCYQAAQYRIVKECIHCRTRADVRSIYHDPDCKELAYYACSVCIDVLGEMYL